MTEEPSTSTTSPDPAAEWWTTSDVAAYLDVRVANASSYRMRNQMPPPDHKLGRTQLWHPSTIINWQETRPGRARRQNSLARTQDTTAV